MLLNSYGPTENGAVSTVHEILDAVPQPGPVPIGRPLRGTRVEVVTASGAPACPGETGELLLGGDGLAAGYLGTPAATAERFVPDPFAERGGPLPYRTGDLAVRRPDGVLEFCGRTDRQLKAAGCRAVVGPGGQRSYVR
ncbi:hypothetical protein GCM10010275_13410 [Streptomyces litmocidini]|uniref:AMP-binding protein n=1 Tax=Streptomyces litmocidini TaxID=67318 RepID=UPI00167E81A2|nr:AMP-binding protein [Streptomyces litmocidini]GGU80035.1 hypothetical protein GCM10010275_13410 [Streptomyces litmocidini]